MVPSDAKVARRPSSFLPYVMAAFQVSEMGLPESCMLPRQGSSRLKTTRMKVESGIILFLLLSSLGVLSKFLISVPQLPHLQNGANNRTSS